MKLSDEEWGLIVGDLEEVALNPVSTDAMIRERHKLIEKIRRRGERYWIAEKDERGKLKLRLDRAGKGLRKKLAKQELASLIEFEPEKNIVLVSMTLKEVEL
jgi:transposase